MKKYLLIILVSCFFFASFAQRNTTQNLPKYDKKPYHFGFLIAYNQFNFMIKPETDLSPFDSLMVVESSHMSGFNLGVITDLRLSNNFNLRFIPSLSFGDRVLHYTIKFQDSVFYDVNKKIESTFVDFPLYVKFKSTRMNNVRLYVIGGLQYSIDLASQAKKKQQEKDDIYVKLHRHDFSFHAGVGADFYLTYFKFSTELKMGYGFRDLIVREGNMYSNSIERLNSKILQLSFLFE
ncbi:MAG: porin family protein [Bacteroidales bacterium]|nr:porin family protein [Bacteroidales bacterium]